MTSLRGYIQYRNGDVETGREWLSITENPDGSRILRSQCEMDDDRVQRDAMLCLKPDWRPSDAWVRLSQDGRFFGTGWFRFAAGLSEHEGYSAREGRIRQRFAITANGFGTHALQSDAWKTALIDPSEGPGRRDIPAMATMSREANGCSGPLLDFYDFAVDYRGEEQVTVPAGSFLCRRCDLLFPDFPPLPVWVTGRLNLFVRMAWPEVTDAEYELISLEGDPS